VVALGEIFTFVHMHVGTLNLDLFGYLDNMEPDNFIWSYEKKGGIK
jgi:hypothetical protein